MKEIVVASRNKGKIAEIKEAFKTLGVHVKAVSDYGDDIPEPEETGKTFLDNAVLKAKYYAAITKTACLADDSGLEVDALNGEPGVFSARYAGEHTTDKDNNDKLLKNMISVPQNERTARFKCVLAFIDVDGTLLTTEGNCEGFILDAPQGSGGFGYDPLFYIPELKATMAELSLEGKNAVSHRGKALEAMAAKLVGHLA